MGDDWECSWTCFVWGNLVDIQLAKNRERGLESRGKVQAGDAGLGRSGENGCLLNHVTAGNHPGRGWIEGLPRTESRGSSVRMLRSKEMPAKETQEEQPQQDRQRVRSVPAK